MVRVIRGPQLQRHFPHWSLSSFWFPFPKAKGLGARSATRNAVLTTRFRATRRWSAFPQGKALGQGYLLSPPASDILPPRGSGAVLI